MSAPDSQLEIAVFGASQIEPDSTAWQTAYRCGRLLAAAGYTVTTGGYGGVMEAVSHGAHDEGGHVIGVTAPALFPGRLGANRFVAEEWQVATLTERVHRLLEPAAGVIALPGSLGTFTELVLAWNAAYLAPLRDAKHPPIAVVGDVWQSLVPVVAATLGAGDPPLEYCDTVDAAVAHVTGP